MIGRGETVVCDFGGTLSLDDGPGYCSDITRTVVTGPPSDEVAAGYEVLAEAQQAAVAAARAGVTAASVDRVARAVIEDAGLRRPVRAPDRARHRHRGARGSVPGGRQRRGAGPRSRVLGGARASTSRAGSACGSRTSWWWGRTASRSRSTPPTTGWSSSTPDPVGRGRGRNGTRSEGAHGSGDRREGGAGRGGIARTRAGDGAGAGRRGCAGDALGSGRRRARRGPPGGGRGRG